MNPEVLLIIVLAGFFAVVLTWISKRSQERLARLQLLEKALGSPALDEDSRRLLADALRAQARAASWRLSLPAVLMLVGWVGLFLGAGIALFGPRNVYPTSQTVGLAVVLGAVALMTLPIALREAEKRRQA